MRLYGDDMRAFEWEPEQTYYRGADAHKYAPDAFFIYKGKPTVAEVQLKPLSRKEWAAKWKKGANIYFDRARRHYEGATWNRYAASPFIPHIWVVSKQPFEIVSSGFDVEKRSIILLPPV